MTVRAFVLAAAALLVAASATSAQSKEPIPRAVLDIRGASVGLPTGIGWTPAVPVGAVVPGRGLGFDTGGHLYLLRFRMAAIGIGGHLLVGRGHAEPLQPTGTGTTLTSLPGVTTRLTNITPHLSFNFGHRLGWSYLSGGIGRTRVRSTPTGNTGNTGTTAIVAVESPAARTLDYGGGARWFINDHLAFTLDLRWYKISPIAATATQPALPKQSLLVAGGGVSFK